MRKLLPILFLAAFGISSVQAEPVEYTDVVVTCSKCDLAKTAECQNVANTAKSGEPVWVDLTGPASKKFHREVCLKPVKASFKGEKSADGKSIEVAEIEKTGEAE